MIGWYTFLMINDKQTYYYIWESNSKFDQAKCVSFAQTNQISCKIAYCPLWIESLNIFNYWLNWLLIKYLIRSRTIHNYNMSMKQDVSFVEESRSHPPFTGISFILTNIIDYDSIYFHVFDDKSFVLESNYFFK